ncbi:MetQ/NlpA family ABC transporter substrate-binding protein [Auritidibacter ignavus]|uniref:MetQ/NlpA family ABC transporter substrate-binding protein n=1 Tax=Auritidibacter ignavus TaxID=678932 RepID=UPI00244AF3E6|nr:MetQ/NlpA family ABC transporter substrate-binding protein [Auritidibacter ignavus]WGH83005.1 MetQ/NlpA family ABC transporter substrate-binding protein [Auritidibacter ignavus]
MISFTSRRRIRHGLALGATATITALVLTGCGEEGGGDNGGDGDVTTITVGANPVPHARILEYVDENLAEDAGIDLEINEYDDYQTPNRVLDEGGDDANYYQHLPFLEQQEEDLGYDFDHGDPIHLEPYAGFSEKHDSIDDLPDGATIGITNDPANQPRALQLLEAEGLLEDIGDDDGALDLTDEQNPKGLEFEESQPEFLAQVVDDDSIDLAIINGNYFLEAGLSVDDALVVESAEDSPWGNMLVWRAGDDNDAIATLEELLHSQEVADFITEEWPNGEIIPAEGDSSESSEDASDEENAEEEDAE